MIVNFCLQQPSEDDDVLPARPEEPTESGIFFFQKSIFVNKSFEKIINKYIF